ncbi:MAG TPA: pyridoxal phosphate-dependent aminotransferase [Erysipelotrichaceae bacterium]|nr:pyridoxal phosphate-dependent aminotransferase [Erysipelotrichaceae bacterium]
MDYQKIQAQRALDMKASGIRKFFELAAEIPDCISLGVGEPDFQTPWAIREAAIHSLELGRTKYTANAGLKELREALSAFMERRYSLSYDPKEIFVTVGGSEAIDLAIRMLVEDGDEVIIPQPCYVSYEPITTLTGGVPVTIQTKEEDEFRVTAQQIKEAITEKTKLLILSFPNNPTGAVLRRQDLLEIADVIRDTNIIVLADEIYAELVYGEEGFTSIAQIDGMKERTIVVNGFSKAFSMTGWRLGFAAGPKPLIDTMIKIHQSSIMAAPTTSQFAAVAAVRECDNDIERMRQEYDFRRKYCVRKLNEMGLHTFEPKGAFYVFPNISVLGMNSDDFCMQLLKEQNLAIVPGTAFGESGEGFVRISYAYSIEHLQEAMRRIERFLKDHGYQKEGK